MKAQSSKDYFKLTINELCATNCEQSVENMFRSMSVIHSIMNRLSMKIVFIYMKLHSTHLPIKMYRWYIFFIT